MNHRPGCKGGCCRKHDFTKRKFSSAMWEKLLYNLNRDSPPYEPGQAYLRAGIEQLRKSLDIAGMLAKRRK